MKLLTIQNDAKTVKGEKLGYITAVMYLAPSDVSSVMNTCPYASNGCKFACLNTAGRGRFDSVQNARIQRTKLFKSNSKAFYAQLFGEIRAFVKRADKLGMIPAVRLNGTSDVPFSHPVRKEFKDLILYDYTKNPYRFAAHANGLCKSQNVHYTFSRSENTSDESVKAYLAIGNVAVVYKGDYSTARKVLAKRFGISTRRVINGDEHDLRFLDGKRKLVLLRAKGKAKHDTTGFVIEV